MATNDSSGRSLGQLVSDLSEQTSTLVRGEIALAKEEVVAKAKQYGIGGGMFAAAAFVALYALGVLIATIILALAVPFPPWLASLIVFLLLAGVVALLIWLGRRKLQAATPPTPTRAIENVHEDLAALKGGDE
jgi:protein-S-isoprenylcysteine O-methyltransferase Ste14